MGELDPRSMRVVNMHYMEMAGNDASASTGRRRGFKGSGKVSFCKRQKQPVMVTKQRESTVDSHSGGELDWRTLLDSRDWGGGRGWWAAADSAWSRCGF